MMCSNACRNVRNFDTSRLRLELIVADDVDDIFTTLNDRHTAEILSKFTWPMTREQAQWWVDLAVDGTASGQRYLYIARDKQSGAPAGVIGLFLEAAPEYAEVGYWVTHDFQGKGLATEMLKAMIDYAFAQTDVGSLIATTALNNPQSSHILEKAGFKRTGMKDVECYDGSLRPSNLYKLYHP